MKVLNIFLILIIICLLFCLYYFRSINEHFNSNNQGDFLIRDRATSDTIIKIDNIDNYIIEPDPVNSEKKVKMLRMNSEKFSKIKIYRGDKHSKNDMTFGFYFKKFVGSANTDFDNFLIGHDNKKHAFKISYKNDMKKFKLSTYGYETFIDINNLEKYNYMIITLKNNKSDEIPEITFNLNNRLNVFKLKEKKGEKINVSHLSINKFNGHVGKILLYNNIVEKEELCKKFLCNLSCFIPDNRYANIVDCIKACNKSCRDIKKCQKTCINCEFDDFIPSNEQKFSMCPWLKETKILDKSTPDSPTIRAFPGDGKILVEWVRPFNGKVDISHYIVTVYETFNKENGLKINISGNAECQVCEHEIKNLKNQVSYDVSVRAVNNLGIGKESNIESITPNGRNKQDIVKNIFTDIDEDLDKEIKEADLDYPCDDRGYVLTEDHILDEIEDKNMDLEEIINNLKNKKN